MSLESFFELRKSAFACLMILIRQKGHKKTNKVFKKVPLMIVKYEIAVSFCYTKIQI